MTESFFEITILITSTQNWGHYFSPKVTAVTCRPKFTVINRSRLEVVRSKFATHAHIRGDTLFCIPSYIAAG
jgi:hypothetical protein